MGNFDSQATDCLRFHEVLYGKSGGIATITTNRPHAHNADNKFKNALDQVGGL